MSASRLVVRIASDRAQACTRVNTSEQFRASAAVYEAAMALRTCNTRVVSHLPVYVIPAAILMIRFLSPAVDREKAAVM
jgi:hypothetical protein